MLLALNTKEPITETEYDKRKAEEREELAPLTEWTEVIANDHAWDDADYTTDKEGEREVSDKAWNRVYREAQKQLTRVVADGTLPSRKRGRSVLIAAGAFYDWRGEPTPVYPGVAWEYDVRPDDQAEEVDQDRKVLETVRCIFDRAPKPLPQPVDLAALVERPEGGGFGTDLEHELVVSICDVTRQHWAEARAMDLGVAEVAEEFDGEDPLRPYTRAMLDGCLDSCRKVREDMASYAEFDLAEPSEEDVAQVRRLIEKVAEN